MVHIICDNHEPVEVTVTTSDTVWTGEVTKYVQCAKCGCLIKELNWIESDPIPVKEGKPFWYADPNGTQI